MAHPSRWNTTTTSQRIGPQAHESLEQVRRQLGVPDYDPRHWAGVTKSQVLSCPGGEALLASHRGSLLETLTTLHPDQHWYGHVRADRDYWACPQRARLFLDKFAEQHGLTSEEDWTRVRYRAVVQAGGKCLLQRHGTLHATLQAVYPERAWEACHHQFRPRGYWNELAHQRAALEDMAPALGVKTLADWKHVTATQLRQQPLGSYLLQLNGGLFAMLQRLYPQAQWDVHEDRVRVPRNYWKDPAHHRQFMDRVFVQRGMQHLDEWYAVDWRTLKSHGAHRLLQQYGSYLHLLQSVYPEHPWDVFRLPQVPKSFWKSRRNQRAFLEHYAQRQGLQHWQEWNQVTFRELCAAGGTSILVQYENMTHMLQSLYPEHPWSLHERPQMPRGYWQDKSNHRRFLDQLKSKLGITQASQWRDVSVSDVHQHGGASLLALYPSFFEALVDNYPEEQWQVGDVRRWRPHTYFSSVARQQQFLEELQQQEQLAQREDLIALSPATIRKHGGSGLLYLFQDDWLAALQSAYPQVAWDADRLYQKNTPPWDDVAYQRQFMDAVGEQLGVREWTDWNLVRFNQIAQRGGTPVLSRYSSLLDALESIYPEHPWSIASRPFAPRNYWAQRENVLEFLERVKKRYKVQEKQDWYRVSLRQMEQVRGGTAILRKYRGMHALLSEAYPQESWEEKELSKRDKRASQRWLFLQMKELYPGEELVEDFYHDALSAVAPFPVQLDIFLPARQLALEFQGAHHYMDIPSFGTLELQQLRDQEKLALCRQHGITLVAIPHWWDGRLDSLREAILEEGGPLPPTNTSSPTEESSSPPPSSLSKE